MKEHQAHHHANGQPSLHHAKPSAKDRQMFLIIFIGAVIITLLLVFWPKHSASQQLSSRAAFAACLTSKGVAMYGEDTCPNCQLQKGMFEEDFQRIHYINCYVHQDECSKIGIQGYPMWMYNGQSLPGVQTFQSLAQISGCTAP